MVARSLADARLDGLSTEFSYEMAGVVPQTEAQELPREHRKLTVDVVVDPDLVLVGELTVQAPGVVASPPIQSPSPYLAHRSRLVLEAR